MTLSTRAAKEITASVDCPRCGAGAFDTCRSLTTGSVVPPHQLRINAAKRRATRGEEGTSVNCPARCGGQLTLTDGRVQHTMTGRFECEV